MFNVMLGVVVASMLAFILPEIPRPAAIISGLLMSSMGLAMLFMIVQSALAFISPWRVSSTASHADPNTARVNTKTLVVRPFARVAQTCRHLREAFSYRRLGITAWPKPLRMLVAVLAGMALFILFLSLEWQRYQLAQHSILQTGIAAVEGELVQVSSANAEGDVWLRLRLDAPGRPWHQYLVQLRWPAAPLTLVSGQRWRFYTQLKPIHGPANPSSVHREAYALTMRLIASGSIKLPPALMPRLHRPLQRANSESPPRVVAIATLDPSIREHRYLPRYLGGNATWRSELVERLNASLRDVHTAPLLLALTVGERPFSDEMWQGLQATGLGHLISISGMHIALLFGWVLWLCPWLSRPLLMAGYLPQPWRQVFYMVLAMTAAVGYAWLAGLALPTLRSLLSLLLISGLALWHWRASPASQLLLVMTLLLLWQPFFMLSVSFWLSMLAMGLVLYFGWSLQQVMGFWPRIWLFIRYQIGFTLAMLPLGLLFFQGIAPLALLSNIVFVPWISLIGIPLLLLVFLLQYLSAVPLPHLWALVDGIFYPLQRWLEFAAEPAYWWSWPTIDGAELLLLTLCLLWLWRWVAFMPWLRLQRVAPITARVTATITAHTKPASRLLCQPVLLNLDLARHGLLLLCFVSPLLFHLWQDAPARIHIIDVGQGNAVLLQQGAHGFLYDLGPRYGTFSQTKAQVLPYLRHWQIQSLTVVVSHQDADHSGDWRVIAKAYPTAIFYNHPVASAQRCQDVPRHWQGAELTVLWPEAGNNQNLNAGPLMNHLAPALETSPLVFSDNDSSCVLSIHWQGVQLLLSGDISARIEQQLAASSHQLLLLSHHGSDSSSKLNYLQQQAPALALISSGAFNAYGHPSSAVIGRLSLLQIPWRNTADAGALVLEIKQGQWQLWSFRQQRWPRWLQKLANSAETRRTNE